jgi:hypothetical protein
MPNISFFFANFFFPFVECTRVCVWGEQQLHVQTFAYSLIRAQILSYSYTRGLTHTHTMVDRVYVAKRPGHLFFFCAVVVVVVVVENMETHRERVAPPPAVPSSNMEKKKKKKKKKKMMMMMTIAASVSSFRRRFPLSRSKSSPLPFRLIL